jgi:ribosome-binding factor A
MKRHKSSQGPTQRQLRVGEQLKHIIAQTLQRGDFMHEELQQTALLTVTEVRPSPDMRQATAYIVTMGDKDIEPVLKALNEEGFIFQKEIGRQMSMKFTPKVRFKFDDSFENSARINKLLYDIQEGRDED